MRFTAISLGLATVAATCIASRGVAAEEAAPKKPGNGQSAAHLLRYRFRAGEKLHYVVTQESTIEIKKGGQTGTAENASTTRKHLRVVSVDKNGIAVLEPVLDAVKLWEQHNDGPKQQYDSTDKSKPPQRFVGVAKTIGVPLARVTVSPSGRLIKAVPLLDKKTQAEVTVKNGPKKPPADPSKNFLVVFPEKPLRVGDSWTDDELTISLRVSPRLRLNREFTILRKYKLVSVTDGRATIQLDMVPKTAVTEPNLRVQLVQRLLTGKIVFDIDKGKIVSRELNVDNKVYGFAKGQSRLHVVMKRSEKLVRKPAVAGGNGSNKQ